MGEQEALEALADSTRGLLRELAALSAEGEALRRELEAAWGDPDDDNRPTLIPEVDHRDTVRC